MESSEKVLVVDWQRPTISAERLHWWRAYPDVEKLDQLTGDEDGCGPSGFHRFKKHNDDAVGVPHLHMDFGSLGPRNTYNLRRAYKEARRRKRALMAPHHAFRSIRSISELVQFVGRFGPPLMKEPGTISIESFSALDGWWLNLDDAWRRVQRYRAVTSLLPLLSEPDSKRAEDALRHAWRWICNHQKELTVDQVPVLTKSFSPDRLPYDELRQLSVTTLNDELDASVKERHPLYSRSIENGSPTFHLEVTEGSLWSKMWEFFSEDTRDGVLWRVCPHCNQTFFPPRRERYYCTAEIQRVQSKREWWRQNRGTGANQMED